MFVTFAKMLLFSLSKIKCTLLMLPFEEYNLVTVNVLFLNTVRIKAS